MHIKNSAHTKDCVCVYTPVFTLAAKEIDLSGSTKSYLVGHFREDALARDCDAKCCNCDSAGRVGCVAYM